MDIPLNKRIEWAAAELARLALTGKTGPALVAKVAADANMNETEVLIMMQFLSPDLKKMLMSSAQDTENIYLDPETGLMWTIEDNGFDISWRRAVAYAEGLRLGGYCDWRLPTISELKKLYKNYHVTNKWNIQEPFRISAVWVWTSEKKDSDSASCWYFYSGFADLSNIGESDRHRVLCVRRST